MQKNWKIIFDKKISSEFFPLKKCAPLYAVVAAVLFFLNIFILLLRNYWFRCVLTPHRPNVTRLFDGWGIASSCAVIPFFIFVMRYVRYTVSATIKSDFFSFSFSLCLLLLLYRMDQWTTFSFCLCVNIIDKKNADERGAWDSWNFNPQKWGHRQRARDVGLEEGEGDEGGEEDWGCVRSGSSRLTGTRSRDPSTHPAPAATSFPLLFFRVAAASAVMAAAEGREEEEENKVRMSDGHKPRRRRRALVHSIHHVGCCRPRKKKKTSQNSHTHKYKKKKK